jgi:hypothetical protein
MSTNYRPLVGGTARKITVRKDGKTVGKTGGIAVITGKTVRKTGRTPLTTGKTVRKTGRTVRTITTAPTAFMRMVTGLVMPCRARMEAA